MTKLSRCLLAVPFLAGYALAQVAPQVDANTTRLLRFPATNGSQIVFSYAGQLYTSPMQGGVARRLTDGPGYAIFPRFSADGTQLAFTAQYDGNTEVHVMPADGGTPRRLTVTATLARDDLADRMGPNNVVLTWKNTRPEVVFRSRMRSFNAFQGQLYSVGTEGDLPTQIPVPRGGFVSFSPDDRKMAYNRIFREFRTWKNYRGGMADDVWVFDFASGALENITNNPAQDIMPMWAPNGRVYFLSDRDGRLNLYSCQLDDKRTRQHTQFKDFDVKFASLGTGGIVFEQAGQVWHFDLATERARAVPITVKEDLPGGREGVVNVSKSITSVHLSPDAKRVVVGARGEVFTAPAKYGPIRNVTETPGVHERGASWSPDGKWLAYVSDATGETELYIRSQDGRSAPQKLTTGADSYYFTPVWSPDSRKLLWGDRAQRLRFVEVESKTVTQIETNQSAEYTQYTWSPDSKWVAYTRPDDYGETVVMLYSVEEKKAHEATDKWFNSNSPSFSDDGKFLLFASGRDFNPIYSESEWNHAYQNMERIYLLALAASVESPFKPQSDEVQLARDDKGEAGKAESDVTKDKEKDAKKAITVKVDVEGLKDRVVGLPIPASNYTAIRLVSDKVYYRRVPAATATATPADEERSVVAYYHLKDKKETEIGAFNFYEISRDGKKMLLKQKTDYAIVDLPTAKVEIKEKLDLGGLEMRLDRQAEWSQIYHECWRQLRDYLYAPNMHGVDWPGQRAKYAPLLPFVKTRNDLTYLIGEMIGELNIGHAYVGGGDRVEAPRIKTGLLGAELSRDPASRAYRIDKILRGQNWQDKTRSPLTELGVAAKEGEFILAVNGKATREMTNLFAALAGTVGKQVTLKVNSTPAEEGAREVVVVPIADEAPLYYYTWVQKNIEYVARKTGGQVGYIHIPDMGPEGLNEFVKHFYPQLGKKALILDDRGNGGGNVSPMIIERLRRELALLNLDRDGQPRPNPTDMLPGPKVMLINEYSASDGDLFPYRFKAYNMGKVVGKRSWGGVVGIRGTLPLVDGGYLNKPESAPYSVDGKSWVIEGYGVDPDIVVDNDPAREFKGEDQQLDKAIEVILEELKTKKMDLPPPPPWPVKR